MQSKMSGRTEGDLRSGLEIAKAGVMLFGQALTLMVPEGVLPPPP
jgi:hypothetical protein